MLGMILCTIAGMIILGVIGYTAQGLKGTLVGVAVPLLFAGAACLYIAISPPDSTRPSRRD